MQTLAPGVRALLVLVAGLISGLAWPWLFAGAIWLPGLLIGLGVAVAEWLFPRQMKLVWGRVEWFGQQVGYYSGLLLMFLVFVLIIVPAGVSMRFFAKRDSIYDRSFYLPTQRRSKDHFMRMF